ncbi:aminoglycoside adenylyltransferase family protein [Actinomadura chibensis]|uniref:aminoglycoside adenylyltransferase family protein n=1 Tax=Actinomadura chibensis TaxID=392828 RepID=UPI000834E224|nr:aminoglycoside adenylyltransferase family protein [Actinomadura chibensis]
MVTQRETVVGLVRDVFGDDAVGAYLHGSAVLGGLRPHSDLDVLAVVKRPLGDAQRRILSARLLDESCHPARGEKRPVELTVVVQDAVRPWRFPPECEFQYGEWLRAEFERGWTSPPSPSPDLAPLLAMVLFGGRALFGPPPGEVLDPVPHGDLVRGMTSGIPDLLAELETDTRNVVLTLARVWATAATGEIRAKDAAAAWALDRLPGEHRPVLARARSVYLGRDDDRWDDLRPRLRPFADHLVGLIGDAGG